MKISNINIGKKLKMSVDHANKLKNKDREFYNEILNEKNHLDKTCKSQRWYFNINR